MFAFRKSRPQDLAAIEGLYRKAFPEEDLLPLVRDLLTSELDILSLIAINGEELAGHAAFTPCGIEGSPVRLALLGPLAVAPALHKQGLGSQLVREGFRLLQEAGTSHVFVLGDPAYYSRFGFAAERRIAPPYQLPEEWDGAWQSFRLQSGEELPEAKLKVPAPWQQEALWLP